MSYPKYHEFNNYELFKEIEHENQNRFYLTFKRAANNNKELQVFIRTIGLVITESYNFRCLLELERPNSGFEAILECYSPSYHDITSKEVVEFVQEQLPEIVNRLEGIKIDAVKILLLSRF